MNGQSKFQRDVKLVVPLPNKDPAPDFIIHLLEESFRKAARKISEFTTALHGSCMFFFLFLATQCKNVISCDFASSAFSSSGSTRSDEDGSLEKKKLALISVATAADSQP